MHKKGCDVVLDLLLDLGINTFFVITGGAIVPLVDAIGRRESENADEITMLAFQHEQAATFAAEGYWRETGRLAAVVVTSGPGVQNVLNGLCGCYYDSIPLLVISGQVNTSESLDAISSRPRQRGFQEMPVVESFGHFCVYAKKLRFVHDLMGREIYDVFSSAVKAATTPRFGPALVDLPVNIQMCDVLIESCELSSTRLMKSTSIDQDYAIGAMKRMSAMMSSSSRPLILLGAAVRASESIQLVKTLVNQVELPFCLSWGAKDLFAEAHVLNCGSHGVYGSRSANLAVQNCDCLIILGSRLDTRQTGGDLPSFARSAKKIMVDIDAEEIGKLVEKGCVIDLPIIAELRGFLQVFVQRVEQKELTISPPSAGAWGAWVNQVTKWKELYSHAAVDKEVKYRMEDVHEPGALNVYAFMEQLDRKIPSGASVVPDQGGNLCWSMQALTVKKDWRLYTNLGNSSMGFAFPCCIGSAVGARNSSRTIVCIDGDGGFQMNTQELKTAVDYNLPIKTFILNNSGYGIIKQFQDAYFDKRYIVTNFERVDFVNIAKAYGMHAVQLDAHSDIDKILDEVFTHAGPVLVDVNIQQYQKIFPKLEFGNALEHMTPFIPMEELEKTMIVDISTRREPKGWVQAKA